MDEPTRRLAQEISDHFERDVLGLLSTSTSTATNAVKETTFNMEGLRAALQKLSTIPAPRLKVHLVEDSIWAQHRFPRTKNRRIRKKWAKRQRNYRWFDSGMPKLHGLFCEVPGLLFLRRSLFAAWVAQTPTAFELCPHPFRGLPLDSAAPHGAFNLLRFLGGFDVYHSPGLSHWRSYRHGLVLPSTQDFLRQLSHW